MFSASVYNLLQPAFTLGGKNANDFWPVIQVLLCFSLGCYFLWLMETSLTEERLTTGIFKPLGGRVEALIFIAMCFHSIPEGVAVGVGYASETHFQSAEGLGLYIAIAIGIHNIPEGLAVALPMRAKGASIGKCFFLAFLTSLPQPLAFGPRQSAGLVFQAPDAALSGIRCRRHDVSGSDGTHPRCSGDPESDRNGHGLYGRFCSDGPGAGRALKELALFLSYLNSQKKFKKTPFNQL